MMPANWKWLTVESGHTAPLLRWHQCGLLRMVHYRLIDILHRKPRVMWTVSTVIIDNV